MAQRYKHLMNDVQVCLMLRISLGIRWVCLIHNSQTFDKLFEQPKVGSSMKTQRLSPRSVLWGYKKLCVTRNKKVPQNNVLYFCFISDDGLPGA